MGGAGRADPGRLRPHRRSDGGAGAEARRRLRRAASRPASSRWLRDKGFEILEVPREEAFQLGVNAISLGDDRVLTGAGARSLNDQMQAHGLELFAPDLEMFTLGGGGAHCLGQALRRERWRRVSDGPAIDAAPGGRGPARARSRAPADRRGRPARLLDRDVARRRGRSSPSCSASSGLEPERDEAGNLWACLGGRRGAGARDRLARRLGPGRRLARRRARRDGGASASCAHGRGAAERPPRTLALRRLGGRGGRALRPQPVRELGVLGDARRRARRRSLRDAEGVSIVDALAENGVELDRVLEAASRRSRLAAYLELHIEQGPVLEAEGLRSAAVSGCAGVERHRFRFRGQASHAGTTPMDRRRDAGLARPTPRCASSGSARSHGGVATTGALALRPGIATAVAGEAELMVDLRHPDAGELAAMLAERVGRGARRRPPSASASSPPSTSGRSSRSRSTPLWCDQALAASRETTGSERVLTSGALHDAAEVARVVPTAMLFCPSIAGISHAKEEDTNEADLIAAIEAFGLLANRVLGSDLA